jgi:hypothetical protein
MRLLQGGFAIDWLIIAGAGLVVGGYCSVLWSLWFEDNAPFYDRTVYLCPKCGLDIMDPECGFTESNCTNIPKEVQDEDKV